MEQWNSVDELLEFAIQRELAAAAFYRELADLSESGSTRDVFLGYAREEDAHEAKLRALKAGKALNLGQRQVQDLKIGDYLLEVAPASGMSYQDALILAMQREKVAFRLYTDMAATATDATVRELLLDLAQEEAKHKLRFEIEYDEQVLTED